MKRTAFFLIISFFIFLCKANSYGSERKSSDILYFCGIKYGETTEELVFTGNDIQSLNVTTGKIILIDSIDDILIQRINILNYNSLTVYLNDKILFENIQIITSLSSSTINDLVFYLNVDTIQGNYRNIFSLMDGYPLISDSWTTEVKESMQKEREANLERRKAEWNIFINYLSEAGKIVGNTTFVEPIAASESETISIYPNPTTGEFRITNYDLGIQDIRIFNLSGTNVFNSRQTTLDVSHLPAGMYFVQLTTEKGIVTKKLVKICR